MQANKAQPYQAIEAAQRKPLANTSNAKAKEAAAREAASQSAARATEQAAQKRTEQAARPITNNQGQTIGSRLSVTA